MSSRPVNKTANTQQEEARNQGNPTKRHSKGAGNRPRRRSNHTTRGRSTTVWTKENYRMERLKRRMIRAFVAAIALLAVGLLIACQGPGGPIR